MRRKTLLAILLILTLAVGSRWLVMQNQPLEEPRTAEIDMRFDYVLSGFEMRAYSQDGQLTALLEAPTLNQAAVSLMGDVQQPRLTMPGDPTEKLALSADKATVSSDRTTISFSGAVFLTQDSEKSGLTTVTTDSLVYDVSTGAAHSDDQVLVVREGMQLKGTGMDADTREQHYRLLSHVEGRYEN